MQIIAVDTGNRLMKTPHFVFSSGIVNLGNAEPLVKTEDLVNYDGNNYVLTLVRTPYRRDKTVDDTYYILTLFAIAKELVRLGLTGQKQEIALAVGLPLSHLREYTKRYRDYFLSKGNEVTYQYNGQDIFIDIRNVTIFPQGFPAAVECLPKVSDVASAYIVDIGGYTTNIIKLKHGKPVTGCYCILDEGVIEMENEICDGINRDFGQNVDETFIEGILDGTIANLNYYNYAKEKVYLYAYDLAFNLIKQQINPVNDALIFVGGGAELFMDVLQRCFDKTFFGTNVCANAYGYAQYLSLMLKVPYFD